MPGNQQETFTDVQPVQASETFSDVQPVNVPSSWRQVRDPFSGQSYGPPVPPEVAADLEKRAHIEGQAGQMQNLVRTPMTDAVGAVSAADTITNLPALIRSGGWQAVKQALYRGGKQAAVGAGAGGAIGYAVGGPKGAEIGAGTGAAGGLISGLSYTPPTMEEEADAKVAKEIALRAARVKAGISPPAEDDIAEMLRQEFLSPPAKSSVPQSIPLPKANTPTYVPQGTPGAPKPVLSFTELASQKAAQKAADISAEVPQSISSPKAVAPTYIPEGTPGSPSDLVARQNALQDIRNATINRPGWVSKLPDKTTFQKLPPSSQRAIISQAIVEDAPAANAVRTATRIGSAGDLASWTGDSLWSHYMKEYVSPQPDKQFMQMLANEIARRGQGAATTGQVR